MDYCVRLRMACWYVGQLSWYEVLCKDKDCRIDRTHCIVIGLRTGGWYGSYNGVPSWLYSGMRGTVLRNIWLGSAINNFTEIPVTDGHIGKLPMRECFPRFMNGYLGGKSFRTFFFLSRRTWGCSWCSLAVVEGGAKSEGNVLCPKRF